MAGTVFRFVQTVSSTIPIFYFSYQSVDTLMHAFLCFRQNIVQRKLQIRRSTIYPSSGCAATRTDLVHRGAFPGQERKRMASRSGETSNLFAQCCTFLSDAFGQFFTDNSVCYRRSAGQKTDHCRRPAIRCWFASCGLLCPSGGLIVEADHAQVRRRPLRSEDLRPRAIRSRSVLTK